MKRLVATAVGACAVAVAASAIGAGGASAADSGIYAISTTAHSATITLTPPDLNACNASIVASGTVEAPGPIVWTGTDQLLSHDPDLADTIRFSGVAQAFPDYFAPRTVTIQLAPGTYTVAGQCTPYDSEGNFAGDDTTHTAVFTVQATDPDPTDPGGDAGAWGSVGNLLPS